MSSTLCSSTRSASRAPETWLSAARVLLAVCWPLNSVLRDGGADAARRVGAVDDGRLSPTPVEVGRPSLRRCPYIGKPALAVTATFGR